MENEIINAVAPDFGPLDIIGTLYSTGDTPAALPGWHVNSPWPIAAFADKQVTPATPRRVFAGGTTVFYTFTDEAEFLALLAAADLNPPTPVPQQVTALQGLLAIDAAGLAAAYEAWATSPDRTFAQKAFIQRAQVWRRDDPVLQAAATAFGLTDENMDQLFAFAAEQ